ncbi:MAG: acyl-CoA dehydrogenase family protein [Blastocatellia bacterium]|nr:acyl-CoA dehydrogenase family protein [Blastocatellia bacterium]MBN8724099.1 acyl-CoA dehydrogenase family protein [Acidobacteriota bacterium]
MDFELTDVQQQYLKSLRDLCRAEILPYTRAIETDVEVLKRNLIKLGDFGLTSLVYPEEYGGSNADTITNTLAWLELAQTCPSTFLSMGASTGLCGYTIFKLGNQEQKEKYLKPVASGKWIGALALTEPSVGSDLAAAKTKAIKDGDYYILNGSKMFITNGPVADCVLVLAVNGEKGGAHRMSLFIVDKDCPGWSSGPPLEKMGVRGSPTSALYFDDCRVPAKNLLGKENEGFYKVMECLTFFRIGMACFCLGIAKASLEEAIKYATQREAFGTAIYNFQDVSFRIAEVKAEIDAAEMLILQAAWQFEKGEDATQAASMAKLLASEVGKRAADVAVQIHGGYGYIADYRVEQLYRDARLGEIGEGVSEVQRMLIARSLLM